MKLFGYIPVHFGDIVDILLVAILLYEFFKFIRGTKATPILVGLVMFFVISSIARWFDFKTLSWIMNSILTVWVVAFVILFQPEIRNALARIGRQPQFKFFLRVEEPPIIDEIVDAVKRMSEDHVGALILIQKQIGLKDIIDTGVTINALVNSSLIRTIFTTDTPLHDGAIVIKGDSIVAAGCVLPLSDNPGLGGKFGLRHRAALGIAEQSDALCVVVSEETGRISFAYRSRLVTKIEVDLLKKSLEKILKE